MAETEMVERVARSIEGEIDIVEMVSASPEAIRRLRATRIARAAIEAMREPTNTMVEAAYAARDAENSTFGGVPDAYRAMIDPPMPERAQSARNRLPDRDSCCLRYRGYGGIGAGLREFGDEDSAMDRFGSSLNCCVLCDTSAEH